MIVLKLGSGKDKTHLTGGLFVAVPDFSWGNKERSAIHSASGTLAFPADSLLSFSLFALAITSLDEGITMKNILNKVPTRNKIFLTENGWDYECMVGGDVILILEASCYLAKAFYASVD